MTKDFRADQIQLKQIIATGSTGGTEKIIVYPISKQDSSTPNSGIIDQTKFVTSSIGTDVFFFVSGATGGRSGASTTIAAFGGDLHISGNLTVGGGYPSGSGGGGGSTLQQAYLSGSTITVNSLTGSVVITGDASPSASLQIVPTDTSERAIDVMNTANTLNLIHIAGENSNFGGAEIILRSNGGFPSTIAWQEGTSIPLEKGLNDSAEIYFHGSSNALILTTTSDNEIWMADGGAFGGNLAVFDPAIASGGGQIYLLPNKTNGIVYNSGSMVMRGTASIGTTNTHGTDISMVVTGVVGGKNSIGSSTALFLGDVHVSGNLSVGGTSPGGGGDSFWQSTTNEITFNTGSIEVTGSALIKNTLTVLSQGLATPAASLYTLSSGTIGMPYGGRLVSRNHANTSWISVLRLDDNPLGDGRRNAVMMDGTAGSVMSITMDSDFFIMDSTSGSFFTATNGFAIADSIGSVANYGSDVYFYVSGTRDNTDSTNKGVSVFGGDVYVSGGMVAGPTLFISSGLTVPNQKLSTLASGVIGMPYGGRVAVRKDDNSTWINVIRSIEDPIGSGRKNALLFGDGNTSVSALSAGQAVFIIDEVTGSIFQAPNGLAIQNSGLVRASSYGSDVYFYVSGAVSGTNSSTDGVSVFGGDLHSSGNLIYGHSVNAYAQRTFAEFRTTGSEVGTALTYAVTGSRLYDFDFTIMAVGTGSGITKRFKRNLSVAAFTSPFILENTVFVTVPDTSGSAAADALDIAFEVSSNNLLVYVSGATSQSVTWQVRAEITKQAN